ncbi:YebC/PmpR family DNA-binding transcriptional regulator [Candidatus Dependentiae bacterium]
MSGHSKWSTIKHKKAKEDAKRGKAFTKLIKEITVAARTGGGDQTGNPRLRLLLEKAKQINMPKENAERAVKKGTGELPGTSYESITYEGYGPFGIAVMVETLTDNKNRTVSDMRRLFSSKGGNLAENGAVSWIFEHKGLVKALCEDISEDEILEKLIDYDVDDITKDENICFITCDSKALMQIKKATENIGLKVESADLEWIPKNTTALSQDQTNKAYEFLSILDDHDDVQNVYTNLTS